MASSVTGLALLIGSIMVISIFFTHGYSLGALEKIGNDLTEKAEQHASGLNPDESFDRVVSLLDDVHAQHQQMHFE